MRVAFRFAVAVLVSTAGLPLPCRAITYYVSNSGADTAAGTSAVAAWATVARVNRAALHPGDTVLFACGGTWRESLQFGASGTATAPITYAASGKCAPGAKPTFSGADLLRGWTPDAQPAVFSVPLAGAPVRVFAGDLHLLPAAAKVGLAAGSFFYDAGAQRLSVHLRGDRAPSPATPVEVAVRPLAGFGSAVSFLILRDLVFSKAARNGLQFTGSLSGHELEEVEAHNNVAGGIAYQANTGQAQNDVTIRGCRTSSNGILGVYKGNGGSHFVVAGCTSSYDSWDSTQGQYTSAIRFVSDGATDANRVTLSAIRNNTVDHSGWDLATGASSADGAQEQGSGIWCDTCGNGTAVTGNTVTLSAHNGLEIEWTGTTGPVYAIDNLITGSGSYGLLLSRRSHGAILANNTSSGNFVNCAVQGEFGGGETAVGMVGNLFENNVCGSAVLNSSGTVAIFRWGGENPTTGEGSGNILRDNVFGDPAQTQGTWILFGAGHTLSSYAALDQAYAGLGATGSGATGSGAPGSGAIGTTPLPAMPPSASDAGYRDPALAGRVPPCMTLRSGSLRIGACPRPQKEASTPRPAQRKW